MEAIATLDPIIARYDAQWSHSDKLVFSARSTEETLMYSVLAQAGKIKRATVVIGPEWINALQLKAYSLVEFNRVGDALLGLTRFRGRLAGLGIMRRSGRASPRFRILWAIGIPALSAGERDYTILRCS